MSEEVEPVDDFYLLSRQQGRAILTGMTLFWLIQKEDLKVFELQSPQMNQLLSSMTLSIQALQ